MSSDKPSRNEDEYFAKHNAELLKQQRATASAEADAAERQSHFMKCPKCGHDLGTEKVDDVQIDVCAACHGIWLDEGELEQLTQRGDPGMAKKILGDIAAALRLRKA